MLFNSLSFFVFFPVVVALYFLLPHRWRWSMLLVASCVFYMFFIPKYILILAFTIVVDYFAGILIENAQGVRKKWYLAMSLVANLGVLGLFKYFNFLNENLVAIANFFGLNYPIRALAIILPVGLSFHTFQAMSYTIEVYRGNQAAERHFGIYSLYVMFFPQLVAGPIERPQNLLPQFREVHQFDYERVTSGLKLMAWGLFKKTVVADRLACFVNEVYSDPAKYQGPVVLVAAVAFTFQIYCDFGGYSDIALGSARILGFRLMQNFDRPLHATSITQFWRRWHISLSSWLRDYLYIPLGGSRCSEWRNGFNLLVVFFLCGLWHGASWSYVLWGALNGFYLLFGRLTRDHRESLAQRLGLGVYPKVRAFLRWLCTFSLVCLAFAVFRAGTLAVARGVFSRLFTGWASLIHPSSLVASMDPAYPSFLAIGFLAVIIMEIVESWRARPGSVISLQTRPWWVRWSFYYGITAALFFFHTSEPAQFIYFQF